MIKGVTHANLGPIWYHSEPPIPQTSFLVWTFFDVSYSKPALVEQSTIGLQSVLIFLYFFPFLTDVGKKLRSSSKLLAQFQFPTRGNCLSLSYSTYYTQLGELIYNVAF